MHVAAKLERDKWMLEWVRPQSVDDMTCTATLSTSLRYIGQGTPIKVYYFTLKSQCSSPSSWRTTLQPLRLFFSYSSVVVVVVGRKQLIRRRRPRRLAHLGGWSRGRAGSVKNVHLCEGEREREGRRRREEAPALLQNPNE